MATIEVNGKSVEVSNGAEIMGAGLKLGIPFSCMNGTCGSCLSRVISGGEKLGPLNEKEKEFGLEDTTQRLVCQCKISDGKVVLKPLGG